jgi:hypothetical protein
METDPFETIGGGSGQTALPYCPVAPCYTEGMVEQSPMGQNANISPGPGYWGEGNTTDFRQYHTFAALVTSDGSSVIWQCAFVDGVVVNPAGQSHTCESLTSLSDFAPGGYLQHDNGFTTEIDMFNNQAPTIPLHVLFKSLKVWECPSYQTTECSTLNGGHLVTHYP